GREHRFQEGHRRSLAIGPAHRDERACGPRRPEPCPYRANAVEAELDLARMLAHLPCEPVIQRVRRCRHRPPRDRGQRIRIRRGLNGSFPRQYWMRMKPAAMPPRWAKWATPA